MIRQVVFDRIGPDLPGNVGIIGMCYAGKKMVCNVVGKSAKEKIGERAVCAEIFGYTDLVHGPGGLHLPVFGWHGKMRMFVDMRGEQGYNAQCAAAKVHHQPGGENDIPGLIQHECRYYDQIKNIKGFTQKKFDILDSRNADNPLQVIIFRAEEVLKITYKQPVDGIQRVHEPHVEVLKTMVVEVRTGRSYPYQIALFDVYVPVLYVGVRMMKQQVSFPPDEIVAAKNFQNVAKPAVVFSLPENGIMSRIVKGVHKEDNHEQSGEYIEKKEHSGPITVDQNTGVGQNITCQQSEGFQDVCCLDFRIGQDFILYLLL